MGAQISLQPGDLKPLYTPGNPSQGLRDRVQGYLPPSRAEDKAEASCSLPGSCPALGPRVWPRPLNPSQQGKPPLTQCAPRPSRVRQAGGKEHPHKALQGILQPGFSKPQLGLMHGGPNQPLTWGPEPSLHTRKPLPGPAGSCPKLFASQQGRAQSRGKGFPPWVLPQPWPGAQGLDGDPEPKPAGEASLGPVYAKTVQGTAGWRKGAPTPGFGTSVYSAGSQVWRRDPSGRAARLPHTQAIRAGQPRPLRCLAPEPLDPKGVRSSLSLVIQRKATPLSCTPCTPRDGGDRQQECTQPRGGLAGFEEPNVPSLGYLGQSGHLDVP
ncbi:hypothetical protein NDU88_003595 [Pleurodeles waltl]|uniref:Uncharacterized protein n=1 Tax=Pleurodeles waltl TaxID=8319 RepID=A0AAV7PHC4_PLEWA|nr:hypothetical protein NDU88_003595 [Pleurodeles waltl]